MNAPTLQRVAVLAGVLGLAALTLTWVSGTVHDVLAGGTSSATGLQLAPGILASGLVSLAALLVTATGSRLARRIAAVLMTLTAGLAAYHAAGIARDPGAALGEQAARDLSVTRAPGATASVTPWPWLCAACFVVVAVLGVLLALRPGERGLSARYDRPDAAARREADARTSGPMGRTVTDWDELSEGRDPTEDTV